MKFALDSQSNARRGAYTRREIIRRFGALGLTMASPSVSRAQALGQKSTEPPLKAKLGVSLEARLGAIDPFLYGHFLEHLGRCVYEGIYDEGSPLSDTDGNRKDVLDAARRLRVTQLRWPGGNFVSGYHWQDGVGPRDSRPARFNLAWFQRESNRFGTDEFISTCRKLRAEPYICVNMGTGTLDEAASWVEYCNYEGGTRLSDLRRQGGHAEPYGVKLWGLGNEIFGDWQIGRKDLGEYSKAAVEFAKVMRSVDPGIKLVACGSGESNWDKPMLEAVAHHVDYISEHYYAEIDELKEYYEILGSVAGLETLIHNAGRTAEAVSAAARKSPPIAVALDEWNIVYNLGDGHKRGSIHKDEFSYNLRDALWVAAALNTLQRCCRTVRVANLAQLVNVLAPIYTTASGLLLRTIYFPLELYANRSGEVALDVRVESPTFETRDFGPHAYLDASATYHEAERRLTLAVVNRHKDADLVAALQLDGAHARGTRAYIITGATPDAQNTFENPDAVATRQLDFEVRGSHWDYRFPRHSISWLEFELES
jgi:alpha-N-arabinofuranosidase